MKKFLLTLAAVGIAAGAPIASQAGPEEDRQAIYDYFQKKLPKGMTMDDYADGIYIWDAALRANWEALMEFPPYELAIEEGQTEYGKPFANGKTYADCFPNGGKGIAQNYPRWDKASGMVKTLELEINECREKNGEKPLKYSKGKLASLSAYLHNTSRGKRTNVVVPSDDPRALEAYNKGKQFYFARRGQLNFSCAHCHFDGAGKYVRANVLSAAVGQTTNFPTYRSKWGGMGTMHRRYGGCNKQVRAKPFKSQSEQYRNLQYFHTYMSNGFALNAPGTRQ